MKGGWCRPACPWRRGAGRPRAPVLPSARAELVSVARDRRRLALTGYAAPTGRAGTKQAARLAALGAAGWGGRARLCALSGVLSFPRGTRQPLSRVGEPRDSIARLWLAAGSPRGARYDVGMLLLYPGRSPGHL